MPTQKPTIAVIGASNDRRKYGNKCVRAYRDEGYTVFPVNPREDEIEGLRVYPSVREIAADLDVVSLYLPPPVTLEVLPEIAAKGVRETLYFNPGSADAAAERRAEELGLPARSACSIVAIGRSPRQYP
jgi:predicted CoA-binding protein